MPQRRSLSAFVIVKNEADRLEACLQSLHGWANQIVVMDSGSTDGSVEIARRYTDEVHMTDWPGYGPQRNRALEKLHGDWVLSIDADECVTPALRDEIDAVLSDPELKATVLKCPWRTWFLGKPLRFGRYTTPQAKFYVRVGTRYRDHQVHESLLMPVRIDKVLKAPLDHYSWRSYQHAQEKHLKYACLLAQQKHEKGKRGSLAFASLRFFTDFLQQYLFRLGFLDGWRGYLMAILLGQYAFHKYAALAALGEQVRTAAENRPTDVDKS